MGTLSRVTLNSQCSRLKYFGMATTFDRDLILDFSGCRVWGLEVLSEAWLEGFSGLPSRR